MISEPWQEQATLYALGLLDADEATAFEREAATDPDLCMLVKELRDTAAALALATVEPSVVLPTDLKSRVLGRVAREARPEKVPLEALKVVAPTATEGKVIPGHFGWIPWAIAALLLGCTVLLALNRQSLIREIAEVGRVTAIPAPTPVDVFSRVAFCELEPTPDAPVKPRAAVLWDTVKHQGVLRIRQFAPPGSGKDYQLWAVEAARKEPVNAGVIHVDAEGHSDTTFAPDVIPGDNKVVALAISLEQAGGSPTNRGPILFVGKL